MARILVVDDVPDNVKLLSYELADCGHEVLAATNGLEALAVAAATRPDVILLDVMMPGADGVEVCRRLKADPELASIPVIMVSAAGLDHQVVDGLDAGALDYVTKPFSLQVVHARVRSALRSKADRDHLAGHNADLREQATVDPLTGVRNRRFLSEALAAGSAFAAREGRPLSLVMLDVDHFKRYNDDFGHPAGDEILREVSLLLRDAVRAHDVVARYGGEEFAVLLPGSDEDEGFALAERLRSLIAGHPWPRRAVTVSLGVATATSAEPDCGQSLLHRADLALYESKRSGRNRATHERDLAAASL